MAHGESLIPGPEIESLLIVRKLREMIFPVVAQQGPVGVEHEGRIIVGSIGRALEDRRNHSDLTLLCKSRDRLTERSWNRLGSSKLRRVDLTREPGPGEALRKTDHLRPPLGGNLPQFYRSFQVGSRIGPATHLDPRHRQYAVVHSYSQISRKTGPYGRISSKIAGSPIAASLPSGTASRAVTRSPSSRSITAISYGSCPWKTVGGNRIVVKEVSVPRPDRFIGRTVGIPHCRQER